MSRNRLARIAWATDISITAPTKLDNASITDTTITITHPTSILATDVQIHPDTTATYSNLSCTQISITQVDCTIDIDSTGNLVITTTEGGYGIESNYIIDTVLPQIPSTSIDVTTNDPNNPIITFSSLDNVAVDYYEIDYVDSSGNPQTLSPATSPVTLSLDPNELMTAPFYHEITVRVFDTAGNSSESEVRFVPLITFSTPTPISNTTITDATFTVTTPSGNNISAINVFDGGTGATLGTCTDTNSNTTAPYVQPVTCTIGALTTTGTITVTATDAGNGAIGKNNQSFIIETILPTITVTAPTKADNAAITNTTITVQDDTAINAGDVSVVATNTVGSFSISNVSCTQTNTSRVDCTLQIDDHTGTGDIQINVTDVAGNTNTATETGYEIDVTPPATPATPDLQTGSDTGSSSIDDMTNQASPIVDFVCTESDSVMTIFVDGFHVDTIACTAPGTVSATLGPWTNGVYSVIATETDDFGNVSDYSDQLVITLDTTIQHTILNTPTTGAPVSGTAEPLSSVTITTPSGATCTTTADSGGNYSCTLAPAPLDGEDITATATDDFGNTSATTAPGGIDTTAPTTPLINPVTPGATTITGTGEDGTMVTLAGIACDNDPITVSGGTWECINPQPSPSAGQTLTATATDLAGNTSIGTYAIPSPRSGSSINYACTDPTATNYNDSQFVRHKPSLCTYTTDTPQPLTPPTDVSDILNSGQCSTNLLITNNMKQGDRDNTYGTYNKATVTQVHLVQQHINRILASQYNQAAGPVDGIYGPLTKQGVQRLQQALATTLNADLGPAGADGIVGPFTKAAINNSCGTN
ncbi:hypothetical protein H6776_01135 [Candidatus Nomurabacteria bacterium]|nr:hypothetical protein [Candidatus Nomurabacteria bacterium]